MSYDSDDNDIQFVIRTSIVFRIGKTKERPSNSDTKRWTGVNGSSALCQVGSFFLTEGWNGNKLLTQYSPPVECLALPASIRRRRFFRDYQEVVERFKEQHRVHHRQNDPRQHRLRDTRPIPALGSRPGDPCRNTAPQTRPPQNRQGAERSFEGSTAVGGSSPCMKDGFVPPLSLRLGEMGVRGQAVKKRESFFPRPAKKIEH